MIEIGPEDPESEAGRACLTAYFTELDERFDVGFDATATLPADDVLLLVARLDGEPIGCGAIKLATGDIKRMWVARSARGLGVGRRILAELERHAQTPTVRLETNRTLTEAIALYRSAGYVEVEPFNDEPYADFWFSKRR